MLREIALLRIHAGELCCSVLGMLCLQEWPDWPALSSLDLTNPPPRLLVTLSLCTCTVEPLNVDPLVYPATHLRS